MKIIRDTQKKRRRSVGNLRSPGVFSYYSHNTNKSSNKGEGRNLHQTKTDKTVLLKGRLHQKGVFAVVLLIIALVFILRQGIIIPKPQIIIVDSLPHESKLLLKDSDVYEAAVEGMIKSRLQNRFKPTVDTFFLSENLKNEYPELKDVDTHISIFSRKVRVKLIPATPVIILVTKNSSYIVNNEGKVVADATQLLRDGHLGELSLVRDDIGLTANVGARVLTKDDVEFIDQLVFQLNAAGLKIETLSLPQIVSELHLKIEGYPYFVKLNTVGNARVQVGTLLAIQERLSKQGRVPSEYIDVRVDEKVYYK